jgi:transcriptional regulator with XRE-family HTH domain
MTMYDRIRDLRIKNEMSQDDLAKAIGYKDRSMITKIEAGKVDLSQRKITAFAKALGTTPAYLMGWEENKLERMNLHLFGKTDEDERIEAIKNDKNIAALVDMARKMTGEDLGLLLAMAGKIIGRDQK